MIDAVRCKLLDQAMECLRRTPTDTLVAYLPVLGRHQTHTANDNAPTLSASYAQRAKALGLRVVGATEGGAV